MQNNRKEYQSVSKAGNLKESSRKELEALFSPESPTNASFVTEERALQIMETELQKLGFNSRSEDARTRATDIEMEERRMSLRERQAGVNTTKAVTGVLATWALIGTTMLARSCINFDKGPRF